MANGGEILLYDSRQRYNDTYFMQVYWPPITRTSTYLACVVILGRIYSLPTRWSMPTGWYSRVRHRSGSCFRPWLRCQCFPPRYGMHFDSYVQARHCRNPEFRRLPRCRISNLSRRSWSKVTSRSNSAYWTTFHSHRSSPVLHKHTAVWSALTER